MAGVGKRSGQVERRFMDRPRQTLSHESLKYGFAENIRPVAACPTASAMSPRYPLVSGRKYCVSRSVQVMLGKVGTIADVAPSGRVSRLSSSTIVSLAGPGSR